MAAERARAELLVKVGQKENALKAEKASRQKSEQVIRELEETVRAQKALLKNADAPRVAALKNERDSLRKKLRAAERHLVHLEDAKNFAAELQDLKSALEVERVARESQREAHQEHLHQLASRERAAQRRASSLRDSLKRARQLAAAPGAKEEADQKGDAPLRLGVFVDAANLSASAWREHQGRFDFVGLLPDLIGQRRKVVAMAYVVEGDDVTPKAFAGFARALRQVGYEVRQKKPITRPDGSKKADWDMGMAMDIVDARGRLDIVVLCTGDGDFLPLLRRLKRWGKSVEVAAFEKSANKELLHAADTVHLLDGLYQMPSKEGP
jgi:uncharacterized LabA/DUF88 family protein